MSREVHGSARLSPCGNYLTVTTMSKRGKKMVPNVVTYKIEDVRPDPRVADPAYSLTKGTMVGRDVPAVRCVEGTNHAIPFVDTIQEFIPSGEVWHVSVGQYGPACDCPHATYNPNSPLCKHAKAMIAVGKIRVTFPNEETPC